MKERKGGNLLSDGRRRRNRNGSIYGARPCIDIAPPLQLLDLDPPRAIRDFPSNTEKWGIFFGRRRRDGRRSKKRRRRLLCLSLPPFLSVPPDNQPFPKSVNKDFLRDGSEGEGGGEGGRVVNFRDALELFGIRQMRNENRRSTDGAPRF